MIETTTVRAVQPESQQPLPRLWSRRDIWQISLLFLVLYLVANLVAGLLVGLSGSEDAEWLTLGIVAASALAGSASILLVNRRRQKHSWAELGFIPFSRNWLLLGSGVIVVVGLVRVALVSWLATAAPALTLGLDILQEVLVFTTPRGLIVGGLATVLIVPLWEELFFRGFVHNALRNRLGMWPAIVASSLLFGLFHVIPLQALGAFLLGLPLAWAYEKSRSLWLVIYMHALNNLIASVLILVLM